LQWHEGRNSSHVVAAMGVTYSEGFQGIVAFHNTVAKTRDHKARVCVPMTLVVGVVAVVVVAVMPLAPSLLLVSIVFVFVFAFVFVSVFVFVLVMVIATVIVDSR
jgi:hypothetical protein